MIKASDALSFEIQMLFLSLVTSSRSLLAPAAIGRTSATDRPSRRHVGRRGARVPAGVSLFTQPMQPSPTLCQPKAVYGFTHHVRT